MARSYRHKVGGSYHGKDIAKKPKYDRYRNSGKRLKRKDRNVLRSSKGAFQSVAELEAHRIDLLEHRGPVVGLDRLATAWKIAA